MGCLKLAYYENVSPLKLVYRNFVVGENSFEGGCRYGINGTESNNEVSGTGNQYDYGFRIYNQRIAMFLSVNPLSKIFAWWSPFHFVGYSLIFAIDLDGLEFKIVVFEYSDKSSEPILSVKIYNDIVFDIRTKESEYRVDGEYQLSKTNTYYYFNGELFKSFENYEPVVYSSRLKYSANYNYSSEQSIKELAKDNLVYVKKVGTDLIKTTNDVFERDKLVSDFIFLEEGWVTTASVFPLVFWKLTPNQKIITQSALTKNLSSEISLLRGKYTVEDVMKVGEVFVDPNPTILRKANGKIIEMLSNDGNRRFRPLMYEQTISKIFKKPIFQVNFEIRNNKNVRLKTKGSTTILHVETDKSYYSLYD